MAGVPNGLAGVIPQAVPGLTTQRVMDLIHRGRLGDLLVAVPSVAFMRFVPQVIEVPIPGGFALSHALMLTRHMVRHARPADGAKQDDGESALAVDRFRAGSLHC
jgi:hypothetical protein